MPLPVSFVSREDRRDTPLSKTKDCTNGLMGPNGAGKSTLMRILATLQEPDAGRIQLGDIDIVNQPDKVRRTLGYLPQEFGIYPKVSAEELIDYFAILKGFSERRSRRGCFCFRYPVPETEAFLLARLYHIIIKSQVNH